MPLLFKDRQTMTDGNVSFWSILQYYFRQNVLLAGETFRFTFNVSADIGQGQIAAFGYILVQAKDR